MNRFILLKDFISDKPIVIAIDSIEAFYDEHKDSLIGVDRETEEGIRKFESLPQFYRRVEIKNKENIFYAVSTTMEEIINLLIGENNGNSDKEKNN